MNGAGYPHLLEASEAAPDRAEFVISRYRGNDANLRTQFERIIERAGVEQWERPFHNLRASRQTELESQFPSHAVCNWMGNSESVAQKHYLQVTEEHFTQAAKGKCGAKSGAGGAYAVHFSGQQPSADSRDPSQETQQPSGVASQVVIFPMVGESTEVPPRGVEPLLPD